MELVDMFFNYVVFGFFGVGEDGVFICIWGDFGVDMIWFMMIIFGMNCGFVFDLFNKLVDDEGFFCFILDGGMCCEKIWFNE